MIGQGGDTACVPVNAEDTALITIFVLLGLALFGGGIAAIVDGWPYLVLERGFTQVIIGTVAATGGVILLALSRVLVELRRVKASLADIATVRLAAPPEGEAAALAEKPGSEDVPAQAEAQATLPGFAPIAAGAGLVAAGGALAALHEGAADSKDGEKTSASQDDDAPEPVVSDLFEDIEVEAEAADETRGGMADKGPEPALTSEQAGEPVAAEAADLPAADVPSDAITSAITAAFEPKAPSTEAVSADESADSRDVEGKDAESQQAEDSDGDESKPREPSIWWPQVDTRRRTGAEIGGAAPDPDDFGSLRQHLTLGPQLPEKDNGTKAEPANPSSEARDADLDDAAAWMPPAFGRRDPPLGEPVPDPDEPAAPRWPPLTAERARAEPETGEQAPAKDDEPAGEGVSPGEPALEAAPPASAKDMPEDEAAADEEPEGPAKQSGPASSEEGVVGAYQVGDTHFTMYADGSISARTPDGEYSFASMDELKVYLASEKSRLGV
jgi:hypothetical protein